MNKFRKVFYSLIVAFSISSQATAAVWLTNNATLDTVTSGYTNDPTEQSFFIRLQGASGICADGQWIKIRKSDFGANHEGYEAFRGIALAAKMGNKKVEIYNHVSNDCSHATWIMLRD